MIGFMAALLPYIAVLFAFAPAHAAGRSAPIVDQRRTPDGPLFALGDIHGDKEQLVRLLETAHLARNGAWTGGRAVLVVTGDMIDKGPDSLGVLRLLASLRAQAAKAGGETILLAGNHEAEFLANPLSKKAAEFATELRKSGLNPERVAECEGEIGQLLCSLPFAARVGDWFFSHGGNTGGRTITQLDREIGEGLAKNGYGTEELSGVDSLLEARLAEENKWFSSPDEHGLLLRYAAALGVRHMAQGHQHNEVRFTDDVTRRTGEMFQRWGLIFFIDTGMSRDIGDSQGALLRIRDGEAMAVCASGAETLLWRESGNMDVARAAPCGK
jgi:hypothetical protein